MIVIKAHENGCVPIRINTKHKKEYVSTYGDTKIITIYREYYRHSITQSYTVEQNQTRTTIRSSYRIPMWYVAKKLNIDSYFAKSNSLSLIISCNDVYFQVIFRFKEEGVSFLDTYQYIQMKRELSFKFKEIMTFIKGLSKEQVEKIKNETEINRDDFKLLGLGMHFLDITKYV
jgi:hypothetical protein